MSRWDYDTVFYRVFCITLLGVAFTFTVILTNVFVDIDGLLSKKDKGKTNPRDQLQYETRVPGDHEPNVLAEVVHLPDMNSDTSEDVYEDKDYQDSTDLYRSKRSLEPPNLLSKVKDQKVKKILTNHLATLLDELDEEELPINDKNENQDSTNDMKVNKNPNIKRKESESVEDNEHNDKYSEVERNIHTDENKTKNEDLRVQDGTNRIIETKEKLLSETDGANSANQDEGLLHLAMHNVILEGIIGNMNLDDVYRKVADLVKSFENNHSVVISKDEFKNLFKDTKKLHMEDETIFEKLFNQLGSGSTKRSMFMKKHSHVDSNIAQLTTTAKPEGHNVMINTVIDITSRNGKTNKESDLNNDILNGSIKLIYNGKSIRFRRVDDVTSTRKPIFFKNSIPKVTDKPGQKVIEKTHRDTDNYSRNSYYKKLIYKYLKKITEESGSSENDKVLSRKRLKRHIKIRYDHDKKTVTPKTKKDDDELFVEIETHFDSKGAKGEKKKKMIRDLISKIQKAIHSDKESKNKKQRHWHVKKRTQDPLSSRYAATFLNKLSLPYETLAHRHIDPISKSAPIHEDIPLVSDGWGRTHWRQEYVGPRFLSKSINSAEMNTVDIDYNKVMRFNGIPQRLQKPINTDMSEEALQESNVIDLGNIKFLMKDIDGSGFTIGFNQYTDEAPDPESMKLFSGIENIIKTYHQKYDEESPPDTQQENYNDDSNNNDDDGNEHQDNQQTEITEQHSIKRRSIKQLHELHHDANEYRTIYSRNFLPFDDQEMYEFNEIYLPKINKTRKNKKNNKSSLILDENLFEKKLKPAEILSIANLFQRWKRSMSVKKISKVKIKNKINRYLNTKAMATRTMLFNKNRHKRQIDKIRVIARDLPNLHKNLEEDVFIVSDEKLFANRASVGELEVPEIEPTDKMHSLEHYDFISPQKEEDVYGVINQPEKEVEEHYDVVSPFEYEPSTFETHNNEFTRHARHNSLMSKYPHIIMEETSRSKEEMYPDENYEYENILNNIPAKSHNMEIADSGVVLPILDVHSDNAQEITGLIPSPKDDSNYKVTVKIRPKNGTGMAGYKEIHTSINKSYNKNGLIYTSLVNVSELSKVEKVNQSIKTRKNDLDHQAITNLNHQQQLINSLIQQHKHRIDEQLRQLHIEKEKLESLYIDNKRNLPDAFTKTNQKLDESTTTTEASTKVTFTIPIESTTFTVPTTTAHVQTTTQESDKVQIIHTIERNENMTNEILKKIDQNTNVLKIFLSKLLSKIDVPSDKENTEHSTTNTNAVKHIHTAGTQFETTNKSEQSNLIINQASPNRVLLNPYDFKSYHQTLPNLFFNNVQGQPNNNTLGIPFVYAIQKPYSMINNETPITSMVYHGHIHTNMDDKESYYKPVNTKSDYKLGNGANDKFENKDNLRVDNTQKPAVIENKDAVKEFWIANPGEKVIHNFVRQNNSRFFIDELGGNYKVLPLVPKTDFKSLGTSNMTTV